MYKQQLNQYNEALKHYKQYIEQLLFEQAAEIINNVAIIVNNLETPSKLAKFKNPIFNPPHLLLTIL